MELYNKRKTLNQRRELRRNQTDAEKKLWNIIKGRRLSNCKFRRQYSVGPYILDFYCPQIRLCVEIDGGQHMNNRAQDAARTKYLNQSLIKVVRFWNNDVLKNPEGVFEALSLAINDLTLPSPY
jgi:very-short-patch-repair endonuclease